MSDHTEAATLVVGPAWVGDMVMAQSLFKHLKARHPAGAIDVLAPRWALPLARRMPEVRVAMAMPVGHGRLGLGIRYRLARGLRARGYGQAIVLPNSLKSALVPFWARIPRRTGYRGEMRWGLVNDMRPMDRKARPQTVQRFVALGQTLGERLPDPMPVPALLVETGALDATLRRLDLNPGRAPVLGLCPGAEYGPAKRWPSAYFAELARTRLAQGWQVWIFGGSRDAALGRKLTADAGPGCRDLTGRTSLAEAVDLMSRTSLVVSNDSGLMHVAAALGRPLVAIYGSSDPCLTPPLSARVEVLHLDLACRPCFRRECPLGHLRCLWALEPGRVMRAMERVEEI